MYQFIDGYPWALLVNNGNQGPYATNIPLLLDRSRGEHGTLVGHIARANEHAQALANATAPTLAVFQGPYSYVTGSWYPERDMPSTYYYTAVHCYGNIRIQSVDELERWVGVLTGGMEAKYPNGWKMTDIPHSDITRRLPAIMGFEIEIIRIEGKLKLGQDEPKRDAMAVQVKLAQSENASDRALAEMIHFYNAGREE
jgi:transcriptional regulator